MTARAVMPRLRKVSINYCCTETGLYVCGHIAKYVMQFVTALSICLSIIRPVIIYFSMLDFSVNVI